METTNYDLNQARDILRKFEKSNYENLSLLREGFLSLVDIVAEAKDPYAKIASTIIETYCNEMVRDAERATETEVPENVNAKLSQ